MKWILVVLLMGHPPAEKRIPGWSSLATCSEGAAQVRHLGTAYCEPDSTTTQDIEWPQPR